MRLKGSYRTAAIILGVCVVWIVSGIVIPSDGKTDATKQNSASPSDHMRVSYVDSVAQAVTAQVQLTGSSIAHRKIDIKAETASRVHRIVKDRGSRVKTGDTLIKLAEDDRQEKLQRAQSVLSQRQIEYSAARKLSDKAFTSRVNLAEAKANRDTAAAELAAAKLDLAHTEIKAAFDGIFDSRTVDVGDYLAVGGSIGTLVDLDPLDVEVQLTEDRIHKVQTGTVATLTTPDGKEHSGIITYTAASSETATRTFKVKIELPNPDLTYGDGITVQVDLPLGETKAHLISPASLTLSERGQIGIHAIDEANTVHFYPITLVREDDKGLWVGNLPDKVRLITVGQDYVIPGQEVTPTPDTILKHNRGATQGAAT